MEVKIDKGIPLPSDIRNELKYPFNEMDIGDSIFFPLEGQDNANRMKNRKGERYANSTIYAL